ncbi:MAG: hypothetical protein BWY03_00171 [Parcubacteria group bacterium ADurb.Bin159]|jgi:hypothetical protein|nr:MAG: hypothetical protein BWY03_00171 [Parcubacteria group bacterium ADurb.Bin159]
MSQKFIPIIVLTSISLIVCFFIGCLFMFFKDTALSIMFSDDKIDDLMREEGITNEMIKISMTFVGSLSLALAAWFGLALNQMSSGKAFIHFIIPAVLSFVLGIWLAGICGFIAAFIYKHQIKANKLTK